jgi:hypothetical protein
MDRTYYERDEFIYDPRFASLWCDNRQTELAEQRGRMLKAPNWITNHSPDWGGTIQRDDLYRANNRHYRADKRIYTQLKGRP